MSAKPRPVPAAAAEGTVTPLRPRRPCPECGQPSARETFPFCSPRCKAVDLNRWLKGAYAIPVREEEEEEAAEKPSPQRPQD